MKKYFKNIVQISACLIIILSVSIFVRYKLVERHSWTLPPNKHILFMGASHIVHGIDDSLFKDAVNMASLSERYMYTYIKLEHLLEANPQIDTLFLELSATDIWEDTDYKYHTLNEQSHFVKLYYPFFKIENWMVFKNEPMQVLSVVISSIASPYELIRNVWWKKLGGYKPNHNIIDIKEKQELTNFIPGSGHRVNYEYLRKIIMLCNEKNVTLLFLETPVYNLSEIYDLDYFYKAYHKNFSEVKFYDYSNWKIPLNERADGSHLNKKGAVRFTKEIKRRFRLQ